VFESELEEALTRIVPRYFSPQSKLGISLTGGLDTRMILACRPKAQQEPVCYTFSGERALTLDDRLAARVAEACGLEHRLLRIGADFFSDFQVHADRTVYLTDGCFGILGAHEIYLNRQARQIAPVRLTGNYGGEVFRKVSTFKPLGLSPGLLAPDLSQDIDHSIQQSAAEDTHPVTFGAFREVPWNLFGTLMAARSQVVFRTPYLDNELVALAYRLPAELYRSREPGLQFVRSKSRSLANIPTDKGDLGGTSRVSLMLRRFFSKATFKLDYFNNSGLPHQLSLLDPFIGRLGSGTRLVGWHKYLRYRSWFTGELADYVRDVVTDPRTRRMPFWNVDFLDRMVREHRRGRRNYTSELNAVLTIEAAQRLLFEDRSYGNLGVGNG
jgi:asparagine synthase (glutamine-hydrolysing)